MEFDKKHGLDLELLKFLRDDVVQSDLTKGVDLQKYAASIDKELDQAEEAAIDDYIRESDRLAGLHGEIKEFDGVLSSMQSMLTGFQQHLGNISLEIKHLQEESVSLNISLENRKFAQKHLVSFIDGVALEPELIIGVCEGTMDEAYTELLARLHCKRESISSYPNSSSKAAQEVMPVIIELCNQAVVRTRQFLMEHIHSLQTPKTNVQIKQGVLRKYKSFFQFIRSIDNPVGDEIRGYYVDVLQKIYFSSFRKYLHDTTKLIGKEYALERTDVLGSRIGRSGGLFSAKRTHAELLRLFQLGARGSIVFEFDEEVKLLVALNNHETIRFEQMFAGVIQRLLKSVVSEYTFITEFFETNELFMNVFSKTLSYIMEQVEDYLISCHDAICILILIRTVYQAQAFMISQKVSCLDFLFERFNSLFWPRLSSILDSHVQSLNKISSAKDVKSIHLDTVFFIVRRYADLSSAIAVLNRKYEEDVLLKASRNLFTALSKLLDASLAARPAEEQRIIRIRCSNLVLRSFSQHGVTSAESTNIASAQKKSIDQYVEQELEDSVFSSMVVQVKNGKLDAASVKVVLQEFRKEWKSGLEQLHQHVLNHFYTLDTNNATLKETFTMGGASHDDLHNEILKKLLTQILVYYQKFQVMLQNSSDVSASTVRELVPRQTIIYEIKKIKENAKR